MDGVVLSEVASGFTFTLDMFKDIPDTIMSALPVIVGIGGPILAASIGLGFIFTKIRKVAK